MGNNSKFIEQAKEIDFRHLKSLVCERIDALELICKNTAKMDGSNEDNEPIFRDLIMPNIYLLCQFIEAVEIKFEKE